MKEDLERAGMEVLLDIRNMEGDINRYMIDGIQGSNRVIMICSKIQAKGTIEHITLRQRKRS